MLGHLYHLLKPQQAVSTSSPRWPSITSVMDPSSLSPLCSGSEHLFSCRAPSLAGALFSLMSVFTDKWNRCDSGVFLVLTGWWNLHWLVEAVVSVLKLDHCLLCLTEGLVLVRNDTGTKGICLFTAVELWTSGSGTKQTFIRRLFWSCKWRNLYISNITLWTCSQSRTHSLSSAVFSIMFCSSLHLFSSLQFQ